MGLSIVGIFHTIIGVVAIIAAIISYVRFGKINLQNLTGKIYFYFTVITSLSSLALLKHGFNPGHIFAIFIVILVVGAYFLHTNKQGNNKSRYFENFLLSFSFFLSWVPTINETFNRVPVGHPIANGPKDPIIGQTLLLIFLFFIVGSIIQFRKQKKINSRVEI